MNARRVSAVVFAVASASSLPARAEGEETFTYRVVAGDTCAGIALRVYGDEKRIDLIHQRNPELGPPPHALAAGRVLVLPKLKTPDPGGPDARVSRIRNRVEVQVPDPRPAKLEDPLVRGNRVGTEKASGADVTFRDETQVRLGERTLVVILGDRRSNAAVVSSAEAMLVTGELRARLGALSGRAPTRVETKGAVAALATGEAKVSVDPVETTRLAVYEGRSQLAAQQKSVGVASGFGSKAELGKPPTPPRPLPPAPRWVVRPPEILVTPRETADLAASFAPGEGKGPEVATWHVQIARDAAFVELLADEQAPLDAPRVEARELRPGTYFTRVSAVDADLFEGPWSEPRRTTVGRFATLGAGSRAVKVEISEAIACTLDGRAWTSGGAVDRDRDHLVSCSPRETPAQVVAWVLEAVPESVADDGRAEAYDVRPPAPGTGPRPARRRAQSPPPPPARHPRVVVGLEGGGALRDQRQEGMAGVVSGGLSAPLGSGELAATAGFVGERYPEARAVYGSVGDVAASVLGARVAVTWAPLDRFSGWSPVFTLAPELLHVEVEGTSSVQARFLGVHAAAGFGARVGPGALGLEVFGRLARHLAGSGAQGLEPRNLGLSLGYLLPL